MKVRCPYCSSLVSGTIRPNQLNDVEAQFQCQCGLGGNSAHPDRKVALLGAKDDFLRAARKRGEILETIRRKPPMQ